MRGYIAVGQNNGQLGDGSFANRMIYDADDQYVNTIGEFGVRIYDDRRDKIALSLTRSEWLPARSFFRIGRYKFRASSGEDHL